MQQSLLHSCASYTKKKENKTSAKTWETFTQPPTVARKMETQSEHVRGAYSVFARLGADLCAPSVLIDEISASELGRKFIKECVVGWGGCWPLTLLSGHNIEVLL